MESKEIVWLHGEVKTPPFSQKARSETGYFLRRLQGGEMLSMPQSRPMPSIGAGCQELRVRDRDINWRIIYRVDTTAVVVADVFSKKTRTTPSHVITSCKARFAERDKSKMAP